MISRYDLAEMMERGGPAGQKREAPGGAGA